MKRKWIFEGFWPLTGFLVFCALLMWANFAFADSLGSRLPDYGEDAGATTIIELTDTPGAFNTGKFLRSGTSSTTWETGGTDNLGDHTATEALKMAGYDMENGGEIAVDSITTPSGVGNVHFSTDVSMANDLTVTGAVAAATFNSGHGAQEVYGQDTFTWSVILDSATVAYLGSLQVVMPSFAHAITLSSVTFCCNSGTVDGLEVEWVSDATPFAAGTDILTGTINAGIGAKYGDDSGFADATIAADNCIVLKSTGTSGTPTALWGRFTYTIDR